MLHVWKEVPSAIETPGPPVSLILTWIHLLAEWTSLINLFITITWRTFADFLESGYTAARWGSPQNGGPKFQKNRFSITEFDCTDTTCISPKSHKKKIKTHVYRKRYDTRCYFNVHSKPTWVSLIYHTEMTTKKCNTEKLKSKDGHAQK